MKLVEAVLFVLAGWPAFGAEPEPETELERHVRLTQAAIVMTEAAVARPGGWPAVRVAAAQLTLGKLESRFARYVGRGLCHTGPKGARCGLDISGRVRARSYWQIERVACPVLWTLEPGSLEEMRAAARCASRLYIGAYYRCKDGHRGAFAGYALGSGCAWGPAEHRARLMVRVESRLRQLLLVRPRPKGLVQVIPAFSVIDPVDLRRADPKLGSSVFPRHAGTEEISDGLHFAGG